MKIVQYNDSYALKVAEMWNKSSSSWGNDESLKTESDIISSESSSGNLKLYLAVIDDEVVGYCSFSEYKHDEGASYLPLLNVRPDFHGKRVGKALILRVLEDAISSSWTRFDLFTWSGNIKAMPLYKKCGFFWERRNSTVHLMNFVPYLFQTEALGKYLSQLDWYKDSNRVIDMDQDGEKVNGFEYYKYDFSNDKTSLIVEFEKTGRGIRLIDTPDYLIEMSISNNELVFGSDYSVSFKIINKTEKELNIDIKGKHNKNIKFEMKEVLNVVKEETIEGTFFVGSIEKDQETGKTHPVVEADVLINGELATFKIGIEPKFPVKLKLNCIEYNHILGREYSAYLDVVNNLATAETFSIKLPSSFVDFNEVSVNLKPKEKRSVEVKYKLNDYGFYSGSAVVEYGNNSLTKNVTASFKGSNVSFTGLSETTALIVSGNYMAVFEIDHHELCLRNENGDNVGTAFFAPSIGLPYSLEFNNCKPVINFTSNNDMTITYESVAFKDVSVVIHVNHSYGLMKVGYELINKGPSKELSLSVPVWHHLKNNVIPYEGKLLQVKGIDGAELSFINHELVDENWMFNNQSRYGFTWGDNKMEISDWKMTFSKTGISLKEGESHRIPDFYCSFVHSSLKDFREYVGSKTTKDMTSFLDVVFNGGNPFSSDLFEVSIKNNKKTDINGSFSINGETSDISSTLNVEAGLKEVHISISDREKEVKKLVFNTAGVITRNENNGVYEVNNGKLQFRANPEYADSVYSITYEGEEWLDSNYPEPKERVWWANFVGGITQRSGGLQDNAAIKEKRTVEFVSLKDNFGNNWQGLKVSLIISEDPVLKGLTYENYCLTLPGVELLYTFSNVVNNSGKLFRRGMTRFITIKADDVASNVKAVKGDTKYKCNDKGMEMFMGKLAIFEGTRKSKMAVYNGSNRHLLQTEAGYTILFSQGTITVPDLTSKQFSGDFILFTEANVTEEALIDLENIKFEV